MKRGAFPTMIVPYRADGSIDFDLQGKLVDWYIDSGVSGLFTVCLSTEMYDLSDEERLELARFVVQRAKGRVPVIASGTFGDSVEAMAQFTKRMHQTGVDAVVVLASMMCKATEGEDVWKTNVETYMSLVGPGIPLGSYECPVPYHRTLSPEALAWVAQRGFVFHKDTCCKSDIISAKLRAIQPFAATHEKAGFFFFNANVATLTKSLADGAHGFSGICANFYPDLISAVCKGASDNDPSLAERLRLFVTVGEAVVAHKYPQSAKIYLNLVFPGAIRPLCRGATRSHAWLEEELLRIDALHAMAQALSKELQKQQGAN